MQDQIFPEFTSNCFKTLQNLQDIELHICAKYQLDQFETLSDIRPASKIR